MCDSLKRQISFFGKRRIEAVSFHRGLRRCRKDFSRSVILMGMTKDEDQDVSKLKKKAKYYLSKHDFETAKDLLNKAIDLCPTSYKLYRLRSVANACVSNYDESLQVSITEARYPGSYIN
eukprot:jgi/Botrbrau1/11558/Bobra.60_1s0011.2